MCLSIALTKDSNVWTSLVNLYLVHGACVCVYSYTTTNNNLQFMARHRILSTLPSHLSPALHTQVINRKTQTRGQFWNNFEGKTVKIVDLKIWHQEIWLSPNFDFKFHEKYIELLPETSNQCQISFLTPSWSLHCPCAVAAFAASSTYPFPSTVSFLQVAHLATNIFEVLKLRALAICGESSEISRDFPSRESPIQYKTVWALWSFGCEQTQIGSFQF